MTDERLNLADLKAKTPKDLLSMAEELEIENASTMRKGEIMFQILRERSDEGWEISGDGVLEVLQDGFGFLRSPEANYLPGPDDIYLSPETIRKFAMRTGDTIYGVIRAPEESERYFALTSVHLINFENFHINNMIKNKLYTHFVPKISSLDAKKKWNSINNLKVDIFTTRYNDWLINVAYK